MSINGIDAVAPLSEQIVDKAIASFKTLGDMLAWAYKQLKARALYYGHGTDNAWDEAVYLFLPKGLQDFHKNLRCRNTYIERSERQVIARRVQDRINWRIPAAYLTQQAWFAGLPFYVDPRVLIPRSPIAELIEQRFVPWVKPDRVQHILDLGTGSACIAVACAYAFPQASIDASDLSAEALIVANINIKQHDCTERVHLYQSDLFSSLATKKYDIIISNPPYVGNAEWVALPAEYQYEPLLALQAGREGLDYILPILTQAHRYLAEDGILIVEVGVSQSALMQHCPTLPFIWLEFVRGSSEVFLLTAPELAHYARTI